MDKIKSSLLLLLLLVFLYNMKVFKGGKTILLIMFSTFLNKIYIYIYIYKLSMYNEPLKNNKTHKATPFLRAY